MFYKLAFAAILTTNLLTGCDKSTPTNVHNSATAKPAQADDTDYLTCGLGTTTLEPTVKSGVFAADWNCCGLNYVKAMDIGFNFDGTGTFSGTIYSEDNTPNTKLKATFKVTDSNGSELFTVKVDQKKNDLLSPLMDTKGKLVNWPSTTFSWPTDNGNWNKLYKADRSGLTCVSQ